MRHQRQGHQPLGNYHDYLNTSLSRAAHLIDEIDVRKPGCRFGWSGPRIDRGEEPPIEALRNFEFRHPEQPLPAMIIDLGLDDESADALRILLFDRIASGDMQTGLYLEDLLRCCARSILPGKAARDAFLGPDSKLVTSGTIEIERRSGARPLASVVRLADNAFAGIVADEVLPTDYQGLSPEEIEDARDHDAERESCITQPRDIQIALPEEQRDRLDALIKGVCNQGSSSTPDAYGISGRVIALFDGNPGCGKTLAASYIASELERDLLTIRVHDVISCWVGSTERQVRALFEKARDRDAVLLLDEADSLLGSRGDADRNYEVRFTNTLLDLIERHQGIVILTTNRVVSLGHALESRLTLRMQFDDPDEQALIEIWKIHLDAVSLPVEGEVTLEACTALGSIRGRDVRSVVSNLQHWHMSTGKKIDLARLKEEFEKIRQNRWTNGNGPIGFSE